MYKKVVLVLLGLLIVLGIRCKENKKNTKNEIRVHLLSDPDKLNPYTGTSADATYIEQLMYQKLLNWDYEKKQFVGFLAKSRPLVTPIISGVHAGGLKLDFEIRPEAKWDNGTPVTGYDVLFSYKTVLNPKTNCEQVRPYFDFLADVIVDSVNPKKFSVISNQKYILVEEYAGYWVIPEYRFDPDRLMHQFSIKQLRDPKLKDSLKSNRDILKFADQFNSQNFSREKGYLEGSGAYQLEEWKTGSKIVLKKKVNWWGNTCSDSTLRKYAQADYIKFKVINDWATTATAIKGGELDCIKSIEFKVFNQLKNESRVKNKFNLHTPLAPYYVYIGMNMNNPKLKELNVRKALAHTLNKSQIIEQLLYGLGMPVESMISPLKSYYHKDLKKYAFDLLEANRLLNEAGWKDTDGNGIRDKVVDGKKVELRLEYKYNAGNDTRKNIGLIFKENLKKIGVEMTVVSKEWTIYLDELKKHDAELYCGSWVSDPNAEDPKQIWHTESTKGGSNYVNYGDAISDRLIDEIRVTMDEKKRHQLMRQFQEKVHNDIPYIFIFVPYERMAFQKRFYHANSFTVRPGYDLQLWKLSK